jgi:uncharacterized membrane protein/fibronectin type 3 domain-containing protein
VLLAIVAVACYLHPITMFAAPTISYVQGNYATPNKPKTTVTVRFTSAQAAGDLNVVVVGWSDSTAIVTAVSDSRGNTYTRAVGPTVQRGIASQSIYCAKNIASAAAGANTVTVTFSSAATSPDIRVVEYSGADPNNPVDVTAANSGNSTSSSSGSATTTSATDLIFGANLAQVRTRGPGSGFTQRLLTSPDGDIAEDRMVSATGSYSATAPLKSSGRWIMQMVAFRLGPNFTISAQPASLSIAQGNLGTSTITTSIGGGFSSSISLSSTGAPTRTTVSFNPSTIPAPGAGSSTMTITVGSSTPVGTYPITVTGNGGGIQHTTTVTLTVTTPANFTISASPSSLSVAQGSPGTSTITTTVSGGFSSAISLSATGAPTGTTVSFNPSTIPAPGAGSSTMTITVGASTPVGTYPITVAGNGGGIQRTTTVTLTVVAGPNFTISASPSSLSIAQGSPGTSTITTTVSGGFSSAISLSATGAPTGTTVSFNPSTIPAPGAGSSTMTITVGASTPVGTYPITVTGNGGGIQRSTTVTLTVTAPPNFTISASPSSLSVAQGSPGTSTITTTVSGGFSSPIGLSATGAPTGTTVSFNPSTIPAPGAGTSTMTITVGSSTPVGTYPITVTGNGGGIQQSTTVTLTVTAPSNFTISASPSSLSIQQANQGTSTITTAISGGFNSSISLSASGVPSGTTVSFNPKPTPAPGSGNSTMTIMVGSTATGTYPIIVTGNGGGIQQSATVTLIVASIAQHLQVTTDTDDVYYDPGNLAGGGTWNVSGSLNFNHTSFAGSWGGVVNAFSTGVRYPGVGLPQGAQITHATLSVYGGAMMPINGPSLIRIYGEAVDNAPIWADVAGSRPDSIPYTTTHVDYTGSDPGWAGAWHQVDVTAIVQEIVNRGGWGPGNAIAFALTGVDNRNYYLPLADSAQGAGLGPQLDVAATLGTPTFTLSASPAALTVAQGNQGNSTITATISGGFNSAISLSAAGVPAGTTASFNPATIAVPGAGTSTMTITVGASTTVGTYPITVSGNGGGIQQTTIVTLTVTPPGIPTAPTNVTTVEGGPGPIVGVVQSYINGTFLTSHTTAAFDSTGGDVIVLCASSHFGVTFTPSDNFGNTWIAIAGPTSTTVGFDLRTQVWYAPNPIVGPGQTVTMNLSQGGPLVMSIIVVKGSNISSPIDAVSLIGSDNGTQAVNVVSPNITTASTNDLLIGLVKVSAGAAFQPGTGFMQQSGASSDFLDAETGLAALPGIYGATFTLDQAQTWQSAVVAAANNPNQTTVTWTASTEIGGTIVQYLVERCQGANCSSFAQIGTTTTTAYNDTGLMASTSYSYRVRAQDTSLNLGPYSAVGAVLTPAPIPSLPGNLMAASSSNTEIDLSWKASTETGGTISDYSVERCQGSNCTNFSQIGTSVDTVYNDTGLTPGTIYSYRVRATDAAGSLSPYSNMASASAQNPDNQPPTAPSNLTATGVSPSQINLSWTASTDDVGISDYLIERCLGAACTPTYRINTSTSATYSDTGLPAVTTYTYRVRATDAAGNLSPYSNVTSATTQSGGAPNFTLAVSPASLSVMPGNQGISAITTTPSGGFNNAISLSASDMPSGTTVSFSPNPIAAPGSGSSTVTIMVGSSTAAGTYPITVTGDGGGIQQNATVTLTVSNTVQDLQVTTDTDDVYYDPGNLAGGGTWNISGSLNYNHTSFVGSWNGIVNTFSTGVRYPGVSLPQGTQITSATLSVYGGTMPPLDGASLIRVYGEAADNAPAWADVAGSRPDSIPYTTVHVDYTGTDPGWAGAWHQIDVTAIVQEIVNRGGWVSGNAIAFALTGVDNRNYYLSLADSSQGAGLGPKLELVVNSGP